MQRWTERRMHTEASKSISLIRIMNARFTINRSTKTTSPRASLPNSDINVEAHGMIYKNTCAYESIRTGTTIRILTFYLRDASFDFLSDKLLDQLCGGGCVPDLNSVKKAIQSACKSSNDVIMPNGSVPYPGMERPHETFIQSVLTFKKRHTSPTDIFTQRS
jgi:hypothetical protein